MGKISSPKKKLAAASSPYEPPATSRMTKFQDEDDEPIQKGYFWISPDTVKRQKAAANLEKKRLKFQSEPSLIQPKSRTPLKKSVSSCIFLSAQLHQIYG